jgi:hypothetical protein
MTYKTKREWTRQRVTKQVRIYRTDANEETRRYYGYKHTLEKTISKMCGEIVVEIDIDQIVNELSAKAANNSTGRAIALGGLVKARRVSEKILSTETKTWSIPDGFSEVQS